MTNDKIKLLLKILKKAIKLNTFITTCFDEALKKTKEFDSKKIISGLLPGIPLAVKDLFCTKNIKTTAGSKILENFIPSI